MALPLYFEIIPAFQQFLDSSGNPLSGGTIETYAAGTSTPKVTYRESDGVTSNGSTITLDSNGNTPYGVWGTTGAYKIILKNSLGSTIRTRDNVVGINDITRNGWVLIETKQAANSATIDFVTGFSDYTHYWVVASKVVPATDNVALVARTSSDGATFDSGGSDYSIVRGQQDTTPASTDAGAAATDGMTIASALGNASGETLDMEFRFSSTTSSLNKIFWFQGAMVNSSGALLEVHGAGRRVSNNPLAGVRFYMSSGNISSGRFDFYGLI